MSYLYYREKFPAHVQGAYDALHEGLLRSASDIKLDLTDAAMLSRLHRAISLDDPLVYGVETFRYTLYPRGYMIVHPEYSIAPSEREQQFNRIRWESSRILQSARGSAENIALSIHDRLCRNIVYSENGSLVHTPYGALINKRAVCDGISKAYKLLCDGAGIPCIVVFGTASGERDFEAHAWNKIQLGGAWYHADVTFDLDRDEGTIVRHGYFLLSDEEIARNHREDEETVACPRSGDFFAKRGLQFEEGGSFCAFLARALTAPGAQDPYITEVRLPFLNEETFGEELARLVYAALDRCPHISFGFTYYFNAERHSAYLRVQRT